MKQLYYMRCCADPPPKSSRACYRPNERNNQPPPALSTAPGPNACVAAGNLPFLRTHSVGKHGRTGRFENLRGMRVVMMVHGCKARQTHSARRLGQKSRPHSTPPSACGEAHRSQRASGLGGASRTESTRSGGLWGRGNRPRNNPKNARHCAGTGAIPVLRSLSRTIRTGPPRGTLRKGIGERVRGRRGAGEARQVYVRWTEGRLEPSLRQCSDGWCELRVFAGALTVLRVYFCS